MYDYEAIPSGEEEEEFYKEGKELDIKYVLGNKDLGTFEILAVFRKTFLARSLLTNSEMYFPKHNSYIEDSRVYMEEINTKVILPVYLYKEVLQTEANSQKVGMSKC